jgi:lysophospholipase L1-like esterase
LDRWLSDIPSKYVCMSYGTNDMSLATMPTSLSDHSQDASIAQNATNTYNNFRTLVQRVIAAGRVPCIPHMPWSPRMDMQLSGPVLNAKIDQLYAEFPQIVRGPDLWAVLIGHPEVFDDPNTGLHPSKPAGIKMYREAWSNLMIQNLYGH